MNICTVGYGMMGTWHSDALKDLDCCLHTLVGRRPEAAKEFAARYGYQHWTTDLEKALADKDIDIVILANPSEMHAATAIQSVTAGKHTLVEIPIAMSLAESEQTVAAANQHAVTLGVCHPVRMRTQMADLRRRAINGEERIRQVVGRFYIHRLENIGGTGYRRSWTDNLLWHHMAHLVDLGLWLLDSPVRQMNSFMPPPDPGTGIPMDASLAVETESEQFMVCTGSHYARELILDFLIVTDCDEYRVDHVGGSLATSAGTRPIATEKETCGLVTRDFLLAVQEKREPAIPGASTLPAMRVLQAAQDQWDRRFGRQCIPGRPLPTGPSEIPTS